MRCPDTSYSVLLLFVLTWNQCQTHYDGTGKEQLDTPITFHRCNGNEGCEEIDYIERQSTVNATLGSEKILQNGWCVKLCFQMQVTLVDAEGENNLEILSSFLGMYLPLWR